MLIALLGICSKEELEEEEEEEAAEQAQIEELDEPVPSGKHTVRRHRLCYVLTC